MKLDHGNLHTADMHVTVVYPGASLHLDEPPTHLPPLYKTVSLLSFRVVHDCGIICRWSPASGALLLYPTGYFCPPFVPRPPAEALPMYCTWHFHPQDYLTNPFSNPKFTTVFIPIDNYQLSPCAGWEMSTSQSAMMLYGWGVKAEWFSPYVVNVWVAGNTVIPRQHVPTWVL